MKKILLGTMVLVALAAAGVTALLVNIFERKSEERNPYVRLVEVTENDTDPKKWAPNWPKQYESYLLTAQTTRTRFGGHGGSEALPEEKIKRDPWLERMFRGYAFSIDYRDRRGHACIAAPGQRRNAIDGIEADGLEARGTRGVDWTIVRHAAARGRDVAGPA